MLCKLQKAAMMMAASLLFVSGTREVANAQAFLISGYGDKIYGSFLNDEGKLDESVVLAEQAKPSFFNQHPTLPIVYVVSETMRNDPNSPASVVAYHFDLEKSPNARVTKLTEISRQPIDGDIACHVTIDSRGRYIFISNYINGSVVVYPIDSDGKIGKESCNIVHALPTGRTRSNAHCSVLTPNEEHLLVCDLGLDRVYIYRVNYENGTLKPGAQQFMELPQGAGPRHLTFHPNGKFVFIINELNMTMTSASWDEVSGTLTRIHTESTIPEVPDRTGFSTAEVLIHPSGNFLYGSNRGHNSIVLMKLDGATGTFTRVDNFPTGGKTPRNFRIDPTGRWLLAENQDSNTVVAFQIDPSNGRLTNTGNETSANGPTCLRFLRP